MSDETREAEHEQLDLSELDDRITRLEQGAQLLAIDAGAELGREALFDLILSGPTSFRPEGFARQTQAKRGVRTYRITDQLKGIGLARAAMEVEAAYDEAQRWNTALERIESVTRSEQNGHGAQTMHIVTREVEGAAPFKLSLLLTDFCGHTIVSRIQTTDTVDDSTSNIAPANT